MHDIIIHYYLVLYVAEKVSLTTALTDLDELRFFNHRQSLNEVRGREALDVQASSRVPNGFKAAYAKHGRAGDPPKSEHTK